MNLILLYPNESEDGTVFVIEGKRARHLFDVLGAKPGSQVRVGLLDGPTGTGTVLESSPARAVLQCTLNHPPPVRSSTHLFVAIPRPRTLKKLLPEVTSMGATDITLMRTWRVAKPFLEASILTPERYRPLLHDGLMQGKLTREPIIRVERKFRPLVEDRLDSLLAPDTIRLVLHPIADRTMNPSWVPTNAPVALALGPEGGFIPDEVEAFEKAGFTRVSIGPYPLRVETACVAAMAQLQLVRDMSTVAT